MLTFGQRSLVANPHDLPNPAACTFPPGATTPASEIFPQRIPPVSSGQRGVARSTAMPPSSRPSISAQRLSGFRIGPRQEYVQDFLKPFRVAGPAELTVFH